jgi:hypothetical protein
MSSSQPVQSPLARLVLFMVCLSVAGSIIAGVHYFAVDLPQQKAEAAFNGPPRNEILTNNQEADAIACLNLLNK